MRYKKIVTNLLTIGLLLIPMQTKAIHYKVKRGDCLSKIAERFLGDGNRWREIVQLNPWIEVVYNSRRDIIDARIWEGNDLYIKTDREREKEELDKRVNEARIWRFKMQDERQEQFRRNCARKIQYVFSKECAVKKNLEKKLCEKRTLQHSIGVLKSKNADIESRMAKLNDDIRLIEKKRLSLFGRLDEIKRKLKCELDLKRKSGLAKSGLEYKIKSAEIEKNELERKIAQLKGKSDVCEQERKKCLSSISLLIERIASMNEQFAKINQNNIVALNVLNSQRAELEKTLKKNEMEKEKKSIEYEVCKNELESNQVKLKSLICKINEINAQIVKEQEIFNFMSSSLNASARDAEREMMMTDDESVRVETNVAALISKRAMDQFRATSEKQTAVKIHAQIQELHQKTELKVCGLESEISEKEIEAEQITRNVAATQEKKQKCQGELVTCKSELDRTNDAIHTIRVDAENLQRLSKQEITSVKERQLAVLSETSLNEEEFRKSVEYKKKYDELHDFNETELLDLQCQVDQIQCQMEKLLTDTDDQLSDLSESKKELESEKAKENEKIEALETKLETCEKSTEAIEQATEVEKAKIEKLREDDEKKQLEIVLKSKKLRQERAQIRMQLIAKAYSKEKVN